MQIFSQLPLLIFTKCANISEAHCNKVILIQNVNKKNIITKKIVFKFFTQMSLLIQCVLIFFIFLNTDARDSKLPNDLFR